MSVPGPCSTWLSGVPFCFQQENLKYNNLYCYVCQGLCQCVLVFSIILFLVSVSLAIATGHIILLNIVPT